MVLSLRRKALWWRRAPTTVYQIVYWGVFHPVVVVLPYPLWKFSYGVVWEVSKVMCSTPAAS